MDNLQVKQLDIFKEVVKVLEKNDLTYYLVYGTLLGAVRHKGFIPWDDDLDIALTMQDYDKFISIANECLPKHLFCQTHLSDAHYFNPYAKIRDSNSTFIETSSKHLDINHGVFIDVFPISKKPNNYFSKLLYKITGEALSVMYYDLLNYSNVSFDIKVIILRLINKISFTNKENFNFKFDKYLRKFEYLDDDCTTIHLPLQRQDYKLADFKGITYGSFESETVNLPVGYDKILTMEYGDYMIPPTDDNRVGHHHCEVIDLTKSYKHYISKEF